jgi:zinc transport system ATP-binding protein
MKKEPVIQIENLWAGYENQSVLENINLKIYEADFLGLIGPNGGGKTTLLKTMIGLIKPYRGEIRVMGKSVHDGRCHIGYVPQMIEMDRQFPIRVWEVVQMGLLGCRRPLQPITDADREMIHFTLSQVEMDKLQNRAIGDLSVGQRQRVYIARALATDPQILLLDEPTASVDPQIAGMIYELLEKINQTVTIVMVSHDMNAISAHVKSIGCINRRLYYHGDKEITEDMLESIYECPVDLIAHGLPHRVLAAHNHKESHHA